MLRSPNKKWSTERQFWCVCVCVCGGGAVSPLPKALTFSGIRPSPNMAPASVWRGLTIPGQNLMCP